MKKFMYFTIIFLGIVFAMPSALAKEVHVTDENTFLDATTYGKLESGDKLILDNDITITKRSITYNDFTLDLNNHKITGNTDIGFLMVGNGSVSIEGNGTIEETRGTGVIWLFQAWPGIEGYPSELTIGKNVVIKGGNGCIHIFDNGNKSAQNTKLNVYGTIDATQSSIGININGNVQDKAKYPIVNLDGATLKGNINSDALAIYQAGYAEVNIKNSIVTGYTGIGIKSGKLNIENSTIKAYGIGNEQAITEGINPVGAAIQVESNSGYAGDIEININSGTFESVQNSAIYEYLGKNTTATTVKGININDGTFIAKEGKDAINYSESFAINHNGFIKGGKFSSNIPDSFIDTTYEKEVDENGNTVIKKPETTLEKTNENKDQTKKETKLDDVPKTSAMFRIILSILVIIAAAAFVNVMMKVKRVK